MRNHLKLRKGSTEYITEVEKHIQTEREPVIMAQDPRALLQQAQKAESGASGGFSFFGGKQDKLEKAAELYTQGRCAMCSAEQHDC